MNTTSLIVEFLVAGIIGSFWIGLIILIVLGAPAGGLKLPEDSSFLAPYLAVCYVLGILLNRLCDFAFKPFETNISTSIWTDCDESYPCARLYVFAHSDNLKGYLDLLWSLVRIFRVTLINVFLLSLSFILFCAFRMNISAKDKTKCILLTITATGLILPALWCSWKKVVTHYHSNVKNSYKILKKSSNHNEVH